ncbi:MAG: shikimate kinase [Lachnospiraceae bacterium]|nr:shikimate kinase [Lachnospiraceae bacterium]
MNKENITLIGMPGAGKSTVGIVLAKILGMEFLDSDLLIQRREKKLLWEIIEAVGLDGFDRIEEEVNCSIRTERTVIATGGSAVYSEKAMEHLREISTIVYLKVSCEELHRRLGDLKNRGVSIKEGQTLEDLYAERCPLYEKYADLIVDLEKTDIRQAAGLIADRFEKQR